MSNINMEKLMDKVGSRYKLVILASKRTLELSDGKEKLVEGSATAKLSNIALQEIQEGKIAYKIKEEVTAKA